MASDTHLMEKVILYGAIGLVILFTLLLLILALARPIQAAQQPITHGAWHADYGGQSESAANGAIGLVILFTLLLLILALARPIQAAQQPITHGAWHADYGGQSESAAIWMGWSEKGPLANVMPAARIREFKKQQLSCCAFG
jgi:hypothetical protein